VVGGDGPAAFVDEPVVVLTQADELGDAGVAAAGPVDDVMNHRGLAGAPGSLAVPVVAVVDGSGELPAGPAGFASQVQRVACVVVDLDHMRAVTREPLTGGLAQRPDAVDLNLEVTVVGGYGRVQHELPPVRWVQPRQPAQPAYRACQFFCVSRSEFVRGSG
jgi:hypothetical protein